MIKLLPEEEIINYKRDSALLDKLSELMSKLKKLKMATLIKLYLFFLHEDLYRCLYDFNNRQDTCRICSFRFYKAGTRPI